MAATGGMTPNGFKDEMKITPMINIGEASAALNKMLHPDESEAVSPVAATANALLGELRVLACRIAELERRLHPVLRPEEPSPTKDGPDEPPVWTCEIEAAFACARDTAADCMSLVDGITKRLCV